MIIGIHQPNYIPWIGYFYKIWMSDIFIFLDDAQFEKNGYADRNSIKTPQGTCYLKVPIELKKGLSTQYNEVRLKDELLWREKQLKTIQMNYKRSPYFSKVYPDIEKLYMCDKKELSTFNIHFIITISKKLNLNTVFKCSSQMDICGSGVNRIIRIVKACGGNIYYSGSGGANYQSSEEYHNEGIELQYTKFAHPQYHQLWSGFKENLSVLDLIFNCGYEQSEVLIKHATKEET